ncbi:MAG TPA: HipA family kinase [Terriglobales bacterium]|nr:HipA family kinase [Terriglobales bacterium]
MSHPLYAVQQIRRLRGGSQAQLLRASDGAYYVTKSAQNPQHVRVLANEMLATRLGQLLGLPLPRVEPIEVSQWLIEHTSDLSIEVGGAKIPWKPGVHLASLYVDDPGTSHVFDYLPESMIDSVRNVADFGRVLVLDRWACNCDGRQAVFSRKGKRSRGYFATFIDQGYCFNAGEWSFPDSPLRGVYARNCVYKNITGWEAFEPALTRAEQIDIEDIWRIAADIPTDGYESDHVGLHRLVETL